NTRFTLRGGRCTFPARTDIPSSTNPTSHIQQNKNIQREATMKRLVTVGPRKGEIAEVQEPAMRDDLILLKTRAVSVLMENVGLHTGADPRLKAAGNPLYRGYPITQAGEVLGEVVQVGADVTD